MLWGIENFVTRVVRCGEEGKGRGGACAKSDFWAWCVVDGEQGSEQALRPGNIEEQVPVRCEARETVA